MDTLLRDETVLITGASGGIGRALARAFGEEGARLVLHAGGRLPELQAWTATQPWAARACCVQADVRDPDAVEAAFRQGEERFGRIGVVVANAGRWPAPHERLDQAPPERVHDTVAVNLLGATWTARAWMRGLARHGPRAGGRGASLCFIGSTAGRFGEAGHADYSLAKAGLRGLVLSLKNEVVQLDPYARVNMVEPGWTVPSDAPPSTAGAALEGGQGMARATLEDPGNVTRALRTMPLRQLARSVDIARAVVVLCSPALARHVSGEVLTVAGGMEGRVQWDAADVEVEAVRRRAREPAG